MKTLSLKLDEPVFEDSENIISKLHISRNRYINDALSYYNVIQKRKLIESRLKIESELVSAESMKVLEEFDNID